MRTLSVGNLSNVYRACSFFTISDPFCIDNARVIGRKIRYKFLMCLKSRFKILFFFFLYREEAQEYIEMGAINSLFVLGRSIGFIGKLQAHVCLIFGIFIVKGCKNAPISFTMSVPYL